MQMPCETLDGPCMVCKKVPPSHQVLLCDSCGSGWHMQCLIPPLETAPDGDWKCVDCEPGTAPLAAGPAVPENGMVAQVRAIQADSSLTEEEKARRIMNLHCPTTFQIPRENGNGGHGNAGRKERSGGRTKKNEAMDQLNENLKCMICLNIVDRPVTTPCGHNSCLKCFQKVISGGNHKCPHCRQPIPSAMRNNPRINSALVTAIRLAALAAKSGSSSSGKVQGPPKAYHHIENEKRPDRCFTSERAVKTGKANAASGKIFVTTPPDHFGPITAANDPERGQGVLVGESWPDRMDCRQWGAHLPHVAGIAGQSSIGAQSVCLSGGYEDDEDHGEWFLYTGSGGRDLSGNKRTNKAQSFDQVFDKSNEALRVSCRKGYPVRVVRSHKEKRSSYAPESACVRYDGIYRIEMCWRKEGIQGFKVCRYLFVRCDNEPAPWLSDEHGDRPRKLPSIPELEGAIDITRRLTQPAWDWKEEEQLWGWTRDPPESRATFSKKGSRTFTGCTTVVGQKAIVKKNKGTQKKLLREFGCVLCHKVMQQPLSTPCGHNFCKSCLLAKFAGSMDMRERKAVGGRSLRTQKVKKACPTCRGDITDFMTAPQVNGQLEDVITALQRNLEEEAEEVVGEDSENPRKRLKTEVELSDAEVADEEDSEQVVNHADEEDMPQSALHEASAVPGSDTHLGGVSAKKSPVKTLSNKMVTMISSQPLDNGNANRAVAASNVSSLTGETQSSIGVFNEEQPKISAGVESLRVAEEAVFQDSGDDCEVPKQQKRVRPRRATVVKNTVETPDEEDESARVVESLDAGSFSKSPPKETGYLQLLLSLSASPAKVDVAPHPKRCSGYSNSQDVAKRTTRSGKVIVTVEKIALTQKKTTRSKAAGRFVI